MISRVDADTEQRIGGQFLNLLGRHARVPIVDLRTTHEVLESRQFLIESPHTWPPG
jgi:hypothetical protein